MKKIINKGIIITKLAPNFTNSDLTNKSTNKNTDIDINVPKKIKNILNSSLKLPSLLSFIMQLPQIPNASSNSPLMSSFPQILQLVISFTPS